MTEQKNQPSEQEQEPTFKLRNVPTVISMRDLLVILGAVMTVASGYFTFETRLTILQHDYENMDAAHKNIESKVNNVDQRLTTLKFELDTLKREMEFLHKK